MSVRAAARLRWHRGHFGSSLRSRPPKAAPRWFRWGDGLSRACCVQECDRAIFVATPSGAHSCATPSGAPRLDRRHWALADVATPSGARWLKMALPLGCNGRFPTRGNPITDPDWMGNRLSRESGRTHWFLPFGCDGQGPGLAGPCCQSMPPMIFESGGTKHTVVPLRLKGDGEPGAQVHCAMTPRDPTARPGLAHHFGWYSSVGGYSLLPFQAASLRPERMVQGGAPADAPPKCLWPPVLCSSGRGQCALCT